MLLMHSSANIRWLDIVGYISIATIRQSSHGRNWCSVSRDATEVVLTI